MLNIIEQLPDGFLQTPADGLQELLGGPTLIHLQGRRPEPLFVSILLHGNEDSGLKAVQRVLADYPGKPLPRALSLFVGNVEAAKHGVRRLDHQPDYNRVWPGCEPQGWPQERLMAQQVVEDMRRRKVFASIDAHNNTGLNPHYACLDRLDQRFFHLATLFSRIVVYFVTPTGVQSMAFAPLCPAVTVECGKVGAGADSHAASFIEAALHLDHFSEHPVARHDLDLYRSVAQVKLCENTRFGFGNGAADIVFDADIDHLNFTELHPGTRLGRVLAGDMPLEALNDDGQDVAKDYFAIEDGELQTLRPVMPAMLTRDERIIRQDCLCYLMERLPYA